MEHFYKEEFDELLDLITRGRIATEKFYPSFENSLGNLFQLGGQQFKHYSSLVNTNELRAVKTIEKIAVKLIDEKNLSNFSMYPIKECYKRLSEEEQIKSRPFQLILNDNQNRVGVVFCLSTDCVEYDRKFYNDEYDVDALLLVIVSEPDEDGYDSLIKVVNECNKNIKSPIYRVTIKEFWNNYFGEEEFKRLLNYIDEFNILAKEIVGFSTVVTPTKKALEAFKKRLGEELQEYPYIDKIPEDIYSSQVNILVDNYLKKQLWRAMIGNSNFALSFVSSEWYYKMYILTENLDLTNIISGYLKSIEQLLFEIIKLSRDKGITVKTKDGICKYNEVPEDIVDTTLNALETVIKKNDLLDTNNYAKCYIIRVIDDWREKYRNKYFHKDNLQSKEKVVEIRETVIYLYFLILGSCSIEEKNFEKLGIEV